MPPAQAITQAREWIEKKGYSRARALLMPIGNKKQHPESLFLLGRICFEKSDMAAAAEYLLEYLQLEKKPDAFRLAGLALSKIERYDVAIKILEQKECKQNFAEDEEYLEALFLCWNRNHRPEATVSTYEKHPMKLPRMIAQYVDALIMLQDYNKAYAVSTAAIKAHPNTALIWSAHERACTVLRHYKEALEASAKCLEIEPDNAVYHCNLGLSYMYMGDNENALGAFEKALAIDPLIMAAYINRSTIRRVSGDYIRLENELSAAYEINPISPDVHYAIGVNAIRLEQYERAFAEIEWYWHKDKLTSARMPLSIPRWYGESIEGKTLLFFSDQGVGDIIMMMRYVPLILERYKPKKILINAHDKMNAIFMHSFAGHFDAGHLEIFAEPASAAKAGVDCIVAATSLPHVFNTSIDTVPAPQGYLKHKSVLDYKKGTGKDFVIGVSWYTKSLDAGFLRSLALMEFSFLSQYDNVRILDLQYGDTSAERAAAKDQGFDIHHDDSIDTWQEMQPLLDQIAACDLVISIDNTTVHAAGALGKPCWVILPQEAFWRWPIKGESTPWYQSLRLFRQENNEPFASLRERLKRELEKYLGGDQTPVKPLKYTRLFEPTPKPAKKILLINDTGGCFTWAHYIGMEGLKDAWRKQGYGVDSIGLLQLGWFQPHSATLQDFDDPHYLAHCRYRDPTLFHAIAQADAIAINGEGMMNELKDTTKQLLYLGYISKKFFSKHVSIINHSCFPEGGTNLSDAKILAFYLKSYKALDAVVVRDTHSQKLLASIGVSSTLGTDVSAIGLEARLTKRAPTKTGRTAIITAGPAYGSHMAQAYASLCHQLKGADITPILLYGAKWHVSQEDAILNEDLTEIAPDAFTSFKAKDADSFIEKLLEASLVITGMPQLWSIAQAAGIPAIAITTGSNAITLSGMAATANATQPFLNATQPFLYEDPALAAKLQKHLDNILNSINKSTEQATKISQKLLGLTKSNTEILSGF